MYEWNRVEGRDGEQENLENRLSAYYGPEQKEQPLPRSSWLQLQTRLGTQRPSKCFFLRRVCVRRRRNWSSAPEYIRDAYSRVAYESRLPSKLPVLGCTFKVRVREPAVRISSLGRRKIKLILPLSATSWMEQTELDVLLATGLARYSYMRKPFYMLLQLALGGSFLLACMALILPAVFDYPFAPFPIAIALCAAVAGVLFLQRRRFAFRADDRMVQWMGRSRVCQGLHALASRANRRRRMQWGEPSLGERINRVCGARVQVEDQHLTLVG